MDALVLRGLALLAGLYVLAVVTFVALGLPAVAAIYLGGTYALTAIASLLFGRGLLELFINTDRDMVFFTALRRVSDPLLALIRPITPNFLVPFAVSLYAAFCYFCLKLFLFGDAYLGVPPLFIVFYLLIVSVV